MTVKPGLEVLSGDAFKPLAGKRVGLLTNAGAVDRALRSAISLFKASDQIKLTAVFTPEGDMKLDDVPVYSVGDRYHLGSAMGQIDVMVCDVQDSGVRYDTLLWYVAELLELAAERSVSVLILDRPNPLGGVIVDGPPLDAHLASPYGRYPIPVRHGLTLGELAQLFNQRWMSKPAALDVIPCEDWRRALLWEATRLAFVPPSAKLPHLETIQHYPGACLLEGTNLSVGHGTTLPFEIVGAPFIDGDRLADYLNGLNLPGVRFRPLRFKPCANRWPGEVCGGVQAHIIDLANWRAIRIWLAVIAAVHTLYPKQFEWQAPWGVSDLPPYHIDRLIGSSDPRQRIDADAPLDDLFEAWDTFSHAFEVDRWAYLLYM
ncbi:MAG TPA: DUF1343 domain-containing protein [Phototrophicaceae bacterium]|nr:DUF1343 domain-containing protein [Phototrophicaceae bacterium]